MSNAAQVGELLTARRHQFVAGGTGLLPRTSGGTVGLRREDVACMAGVSVSWYTRLAQGRDVTPSRQVLDALAGTLRLTTAEHGYLLSLAGYSAPHQCPSSETDATPTHVDRLLKAVGTIPAFAIASDWTIAAWNEPCAALYPHVASVAASDRNLLWLLFTDPYLRELVPDLDTVRSCHVAAFRAQAGTLLAESPFCDIVGRLLEASTKFSAAWHSHDVDTLPARTRLFRHPRAGDLYMEQHCLACTDNPQMHLVFFTPLSTNDTPTRLRRLLDTPPATPSSAKRDMAVGPLVMTDQRLQPKGRDSLHVIGTLMVTAIAAACYLATACATTPATSARCKRGRIHHARFHHLHPVAAPAGMGTTAN
jgi:transcriptional regulator with XRE-family HTH domain